MRTLILALAVASPSAALAGDLFPTFDTGWRWAVTEPAPGGLQRYGYVDGEPGRPGWWRVRVECGLQDPRTGKVLKRVIGTGEGTRGRMPGFGGRWDLPDGRCGSYIVTQDDKNPENLSLYGEMDGVSECPRRGVGALSSGD
ncbi:hypothetical protein A3862_04180 [Methylobacterium sp. XJLW]|uniref:hypothetical protein n=1 Tax=Methylobacterium sp. XJLW TaxID=739141 RepID=UPI000DAADDFB|nr:hypothetical protein [Methylobacterium sp. XJLW]AWV14797.1 hypothetical protein A3862_04180 [Methylobacterium sp. XJLW]